MSDKDDDESPASGEGGGFFGAIKKAGQAVKNAVIEPEDGDEDEDEKPKVKAKAPAKATASAPPQRTSYVPPPTPNYGVVPPYPGTTSQAAIDPEFAAIIEKETAEAAKPAFTAFEAAEAAMRASIPNEMQRIQAAVAAVSVQGHTLPAILTDTDECLAAIDKREQDLRISFEKKTKEKVGGLEQKADAIAQAIAAKNADIARMQQEVTAMETERQQALGSVNVEREKLTNKLNSFLATINVIRAKWLAKKQSIKANTGAQ